MEQSLRDRLAIFSQNPDAPRPEEVRRNEHTRSSAFEEGYRKGLEEAGRHAEDKAAAIDAALAQVPGMVQALAAEIEASHARAVSVALKSALPRLAERAAASEVIEAIMEAARSDLSGTVEVQSSIAFAQELAPILSQMTTQPKIRLSPDSSLAGYAIRLSWAGGGGEMDITGMIDRCLSLLETEDERDRAGARPQGAQGE